MKPAPSRSRLGSAHTSRARVRRLSLWVGYWVALFVLTHTPVVGGGRFHFDFADKIAHVVLYFLLTWLGGRYLASRGPLTVQVILWWAGVYAGYGVLDEWVQKFVARTTSLGDWLADMTGVALATILRIWTARRGSYGRGADGGVTGD